MKVHNVHERTVAATPEQIAPFIADFDRIWPTQLTTAPRPRGERLFETARMLWHEYERPGAMRAFRVVSPDELRAEHWFELECVSGGTLVRHTIDGEALGEYEQIWRDRIEPGHHLVLEAVLDNIEAAVAQAGRGDDQTTTD